MRPEDDVRAVAGCCGLLELLWQVGVNNLNRNLDAKVFCERCNGLFQRGLVAVVAGPDSDYAFFQRDRWHGGGHQNGGQ